MHFSTIFRITGLFLTFASLFNLFPILVALWYQEDEAVYFLSSFFITLIVGLLLIFFTNQTQELRGRDGFMVTVLFYLGVGLFSSFPIFLILFDEITFTESVFEAVSALTTTGATVIVGLDELPRSLLFYRQLLQWLGGMGIIILAVAVLPMLGVGGMQLYRTESPGPQKDTKITPRIKGTAKTLWLIYLLLTVSCAFFYWLSGMTLFDAVCHSFSTVSIGGFSTYDDNLGYFQSSLIELVAVAFMILSGINFALHYLAFRQGSLKVYLQDREVLVYLMLMLSVLSLASISLFAVGFGEERDSLRLLLSVLLHTVSIATTTGFTTLDYQHFPVFTSVLFIFAAFIGGCAGSTAGGIKVIRVILVFLQGLREISKLIHPNGVFNIKLSGKLVPQNVLDSVWSFCGVYVLTFMFIWLLLLFTGLDFITSFSAVAATLNNLGPGLGEVASNYQSISSFGKWVLIWSMILGRLEIFTFLVVMTPLFWKR